VLPVDAHITFQIIAVVLGAVVLWVLYAIVRLPSRTPAVAKKEETPVAKSSPEPEPEKKDDDEKS
jgi:hypothetical protein